MIPIFVVFFSVILGLKSQGYSATNKLILFDACFDYVSFKNKTREPVQYNSDSYEKEKDQLFDLSKFLPSVPDSLVKEKKAIHPDSLKQKTSANSDSLANIRKAYIADSVQKAKKAFVADSVQKAKKAFVTDSVQKAKNAFVADSIQKSKRIFIADSLAKSQKPLVPVLKLSKADSLKLIVRQDSLRRIEIQSKDSTARIKYFHFHREDYPAIQFRLKKPSSFFAAPSPAFTNRTIRIDSTGKKVTISETLGGMQIKEPIEMSLDDYVKQRLNSVNRDVWEKQGYEYKVKEGKKDLSQLITDLTNIEIPLPSTPLLSIFGPPKINLHINGQVDIHGAWRSETTTGVTTSALGNTTNEPDFKQQVQINLAGTIGDKLNISADWNTERQFQYENQLKIKYSGYEDEIIQSIEAGNVSLQTSPLVGGSEALFGVKALLKMGPFSLTALASQKKSEIQEVAVSGGAKSQPFEVHAFNYSQNHYFIDSVYADPDQHIFSDYYNNPTPKYPPALLVKELQVWKTITGLFNPNERKANAYINLAKRSDGNIYSDALHDSTTNSTINGIQIINNRFVLLQEGVDYTYHPETGFISFRTQIQDQDAIAVAYRIDGGGDPNVYCGEFIRDLQNKPFTRLVLKLIKPPNLQPQYKQAWKLQLRNIYPIGGRSVKEDGFTLDIKYITPGSEPLNTFNNVRLIQAFGLDKTDKSKTGGPDGLFDFFANLTIIPETGEIIFPVLQPFGRDFPRLLPDSLKYQAVYDTTVTFAQQDRSKDRFILTGNYSAAVSSVYNIGFNVVENSVKVFLDGNPQKENIDFTVDYNLGQIVIKNDKALMPNANLKITYEQNDLFQLASKTLIGLRGLLEFNRETTLGFSFLNLNQQTLSDKVRIGEEPLNNSIYGLDFKTNINLPFITKALDKVISTSTPSSLNVTGEFAYINPDPNTKKSTIPSDNGNSVAYIDDFEGAKRIIPLGMAYASWHDISVPENLPYISTLDKLPTGNNDAQMNYKAKTFWYNITPPNVFIKDIYGNRKQAAPDAQQITTLDLDFIPTQKGFYNWFPNMSDPKKNWGGIMKVLSSTANNLIEENIGFIEFWVNIPKAPKGLKLNIDLGQISEDVIPNGKLDTEDKNGNGLLVDGADLGLDGLPDLQEPGYDPVSNPDPSGDDYSFNLSSGDYSHVNGTEGNGVSIDQGRIPDSEDLNGNYTLDQVNSYYHYVVPMDTNRAVNKFVQGGGDNAGWYLIRVPLKDFVETVGSPSFSVVEFIRFWISGVTEEVHLRFAEMNLVGNQWQKVLTPTVTTDDTVLAVSTINLEDNPEYSSPPGVFREQDRTNPQYTIFKNEQSLNLKITNLVDGDKREIVRYLTRPLDVFNYKEMKLFIHGDENNGHGSVSYYDSTNQVNYGSEVYLRFGSDSLNFYEYKQPVRAGWNEVSMVFSELTAIKIKRDSLAATKSILTVAVPGKAGHTYGVLGNPTLTSISYFTIGIINPRDKGTPHESVSGTVWVDELRVIEAEQTPGFAYSVTAALQLADLMRVSFNLSRKNPYFHLLNERFGNREDNKSWGVSVDFDLLKVLPVNLPGSNIRIGYSRTEQYSNPLYIPGTDIKISDAQDQVRSNKTLNTQQIADSVAALVKNAETASISETWTLSNFRIKIPSDVWYIRDTFNNLVFGFNYNKSTGNSPTISTNEAWIWNASANYSVNLSHDLFFKPANIPIIGSIFDFLSDYKDMKIYYAPQSITSSFTATRKRAFSVNRGTLAQPIVQRDFTATRGAGLSWIVTEGGFLNLSVNYNFDVQSTLAYLLADSLHEFSEGQIWRSIFGGAMFGKDYNFKQTLDIKTNPKLPNVWDINRYIVLNGDYNVSYSWQNNFQQVELGRSAGYNNRFTFGLLVRVKPIFAPLFSEQTAAPASQPQPAPNRVESGRTRPRQNVGNENQQQNLPQTTNAEKGKATSHADSLASKQEIKGNIAPKDSVAGQNLLKVSLEYLKLGLKYIFFDYDQVSLNFAQSSTYSGGGLIGEGTGLNNFFGIIQSSSKGPNRSFMLGLSNDLGPRVPNGNITDAFSQKNDIDFKTTRPLWDGATIDLSWKVGWGVNNTMSFSTDSLGQVTITNPQSTGTLERSFLSFPSTSIFSVLGTGLNKVHDLYDPSAPDPNASLSNAFTKGFEAFSFISKIPFISSIARYLPRPNWNFTWNGLERISFLNFASRVSVTHSYISTYSEGWMIIPGGEQQMQSQRVDYGFQPLFGLTMGFDKFFGGTFQSQFRYGIRSSFSLGVSTQNITESYNRDVSFTASFLKNGFELPLFGLQLKNDLEISLSYTNTKTSSVIYDMNVYTTDGVPLEGKTSTTIEPRIKYVMSSRVTLTIFYRRTSIEPEGASRIPPTTTNEAGVDVRITVQ